jgi:hypothetical protein
MKKISSLALSVLIPLGAISSFGGVITENFNSDPATDGWKTFGDTNLFHWDSANQNLAVQWDSWQANSYFYRPLGTVLARDDDFSIAFDLRLDSIGAGADTNKPYSFSLGIGLLNLEEARQPGFLRGTGYSSPDLAEIAYFWDSGFGATFWPTFVDTNSSFNYVGSGSDYAIYELVTSNWYRVVMSFSASNQTLTTTLTNLQTSFGLALTNVLGTGFTDFRVDAFGINNYNDTGGYGGSLAATGAVANVVIVLPPPPVAKIVGGFSQGTWQTSFEGRANWSYTLQRTIDFVAWSDVSTLTPAVAGTVVMSDDTPPAGRAFYRVRARRT